MKRFLLAVCTVLLLGCGNAASEGSLVTDSTTAEQAVSNEPIHVRQEEGATMRILKDATDKYCKEVLGMKEFKSKNVSFM